MIIDYLPSIAAFFVVQLLGVMSPGPDFAIVVKNSLVYSRKTAILTVLGVSLGILVHLTYILLGFGVLISKTAWLFTTFKYLGGGYLLYIGIKGILAKKQLSSGQNDHEKPIEDISAFTAIRTGFLTNALNPKAMLFFLSLISAFVTAKEPSVIVIIYASIIFITTFLWFLFLAICFSNQRLRTISRNFQHIIERITGGLLILLGIKMFFSKASS